LKRRSEEERSIRRKGGRKKRTNSIEDAVPHETCAVHEASPMERRGSAEEHCDE
jgi:hypothetical protein